MKYYFHYNMNKIGYITFEDDTIIEINYDYIESIVNQELVYFNSGRKLVTTGHCYQQMTFTTRAGREIICKLDKIFFIHTTAFRIMSYSITGPIITCEAISVTYINRDLD